MHDTPRTQSHITQFISDALDLNVSKATIVEQLTAVGWTEDAIEAAYAEALVARGVPVPQEDTKGAFRAKASTMDIVLSFFSFIVLGIAASALGTLYYQIINLTFPDPLRSSQYSYYAVNAATDALYYAIAALLIAYPIYYASMRFLFRRFRADSGKVESKLTKWITYLVLLVASVTIVGDLIAILTTFFKGELTVRFFLKALTLLVIAGSVFGFYFMERKLVQYKQDVPRRVFQRFGVALTIVVFAGIALGFMVAGSPATERARALDDQRAQDLRDLASCIDDYTRQFEALPSSLEDLERNSQFSWCARYNDPESGERYEYSVVSPLADVAGRDVREGVFELCATFTLSSDDPWVRATRATGVGSKWYEHGAGRSCDRETAVVRNVAR